MMEPRPARDEIRSLVRELLRDLMAAKGADAKNLTAPPAEAEGDFSGRVRQALAKGSSIEIVVAQDRDLNAFARQVALCALERDLLGAIAANRVRFRLAGQTAAAKPSAPSQTAVAERTFTWDKGLLSEARISEIAKSHARLVLGPRAVLTPLARDRARALKLAVERLKP